MPMNTITFANTVGLTKFEKPMKIEADRKVWDWEKVFTTGRMSAGQIKFYQYTGLGSAQLINELQAVPFENAHELDPITLTAVKFAKGFIVSDELIDDNQQISDFLGSLASSLGISHAHARDYCSASIFTNAFSTSYTGWDSKPLCEDDHTTVHGETIDNEYTATSVAWDSLWDMRKYFMSSLYTEDGTELSDEPKYLVCHPSVMDTVEAILTSPGKYDEADLHANTLRNFVTPIYCRLLGTSTYYFMLGSKMKEYLQFRQKKDVETKWSDAFENIGKKCRTYQRFAYGFTDYRFVIGSAGA